MTSSFARMSALVEDGAIKLIELHAVPRSLSTVLGRCLNESGLPSVFVNEPFNPMNSDAEVSARHVVRSAQPLLTSTGGPVVVVTKSMARYLSVPVFRQWTDVCCAVVWCVREPWLQISSLVTRVANDALFGVGADRLQQGDLLPAHLEMVSRVLQKHAIAGLLEDGLASDRCALHRWCATPA